MQTDNKYKFYIDYKGMPNETNESEWKPKLAEVLKRFHAIHDKEIRLSYNHHDGYIVFPEFECQGFSDKDIYSNQENFDTAKLKLRVRKGIEFYLSIDTPLTLQGAAEKIIKECGEPAKKENDKEHIILIYTASSNTGEFNMPYPFKLESFEEIVKFNLARPNKFTRL